MFGNTLEEVMQLQKDKFPFRKLPWIQTTLSEHVSFIEKSSIFIKIENPFVFCFLNIFFLFISGSPT